MGDQSRKELGKGGRQQIQSSFAHKKIVEFSGTPKMKAMWVPSIPSWEKEFCKQSVRRSWKRICELKKCTVYFPEIEKWNDSAAEEAFETAKKRYISKIKGAPCEIPQLDPNEYIDEVDWNSLLVEDIDWADEYSSDFEDGENCRRMESPPILYYDMTKSEKERYEKNKSQWKERPFGYGQIYFPEIQEARTVICKAVDLYTAEPQLLNHWKVDLWSDDFKLPNSCVDSNEFLVSGWGSEFENDLKKCVFHSQCYEQNEEIHRSESVSEFENEKKEICDYVGDSKVRNENEAIHESGWGSQFDYDRDLICHSRWGLVLERDYHMICHSRLGPQFDYDRDIISHSQWGSLYQCENEVIHPLEWESEFEYKNIVCRSKWVSEFEDEKKIISHSTTIPLTFDNNPKKRWKMRNQHKRTKKISKRYESK